MGFNFRGLAFKQSMMILAAITIVFGLILGIMNHKTQAMLNQMTTENGEEISRANVNYIDKLFNASSIIGNDLADPGLAGRSSLTHILLPPHLSCCFSCSTVLTRAMSRRTLEILMGLSR